MQMDPTVELAIATVQAEYPEHQWHDLPSHLRVSLIYDEIRRLDLAFWTLRQATREQTEKPDRQDVTLLLRPGASLVEYQG
jgi:hypothetical protein